MAHAAGPRSAMVSAMAPSGIPATLPSGGSPGAAGRPAPFPNSVAVPPAAGIFPAPQQQCAGRHGHGQHRRRKRAGGPRPHPPGSGKAAVAAGFPGESGSRNAGGRRGACHGPAAAPGGRPRSGRDPWKAAGRCAPRQDITRTSTSTSARNRGMRLDCTRRPRPWEPPKGLGRPPVIRPVLPGVRRGRGSAAVPSGRTGNGPGEGTGRGRRWESEARWKKANAPG